MEINLSTKQLRVIQKITGEDPATVLQKVINDWYATLVKHEIQRAKTVDAITDDIDKMK